MGTKQDLERLIDSAYENGDVLDEAGDYDEEKEEGWGAELIQDGSLFLVVENNGPDQTIKHFTDIDAARSAFDELKQEIESEEE
jgi:hypothetical protein